MNPWHDIGVGEKAPEIVTGIIEIPSGSSDKFELDKETGLLRLDRLMSSAVHYPTNYGFIPKTYCDDEDPLDILVLSRAKIPPMCLVDVRVVGVMHMIDNGEQDDKIIGVAMGDKSVEHIHDLKDINQNEIDQIKVFFGTYKYLENKVVEIGGIHGREKAIEVVKASMEMYKQKFA